MHVVVIGGAGFIGSHVSDVLLARGYRVTVVDDLSKGTLSNLEHNLAHAAFRFEKLDVRQLAKLQEVGQGCDAVLHLAAAKIPRYSSAYEVITANLDGARAALELARAAGAKFVLASTSDVYGKSPHTPFREDGDLVIGPSTSRRWAYAISKLADEHLAFSYAQDHGLRVAILRFFGTYGERQYLSWWGGPQGVFLEAMAKGEPVEIHGDGRQSRCFIYVKDLAEGVVRAIERPAADGQILNIGRAEEVSVLELAEVMHRESGTSGALRLRFVPYESLPGNYEDVMRRVPDLEKMRRVLEFSADVSLEDGVRRLWAWYRAR